MNIQEKFIDNLYQQVDIDGINRIVSILEDPPGRRPAEELKSLSHYFNSKSEDEKIILKKMIKLAVESTIFDILCILDQVCTFDDDIENIKILAMNKAGEEILVNDDNKQYLHDLFNIARGNSR
ncbi:hypothetical protein F9B74_03950 [Pelistega sp. NLN82]|uniref:Uncharacterized protein n=1 Tax=Pelistega ratti TaxID=2652177 RepID=A0A6L9Y521_9BURK|nr:hypothetical protein [Pelistega ratti]NEN75479.1 hypothetical protein [Pelistega ratti]